MTEIIELILTLSQEIKTIKGILAAIPEITLGEIQ